MNWSVIGAVSEVIGAVAVVISLIYLATQIRQATKIARANTRNAITESIRLQARCYRDMRHWENIYYQVREGLISEEEWRGFRKNLAALLAVPIYQDYWENEAGLYSGPFRQELESVIRDLPDVKARVRFAERFRN